LNDYYDILGVDKGSSKDEIKKAYRKVAMKFHPDRNPDNKDAETKFKEAAEAYSVLSDDQKKAQYDQFGHAGMNGNGFNSSGFTDMNDIFSNFSDIFEASGFGDIFGGGGGRTRRQRKGTDLKLSIPVTLEDVYSGAEKSIKIKRLENCKSCTGSGAEKGAKPITCTGCNGSGEIRRMQRSLFGQVMNVQPCQNCKGTGKVISNPCKSCRGDGVTRISASVSFEIPPGISGGNYMTQRGEGNKGPNGVPAGDLMIYFEEIEHSLFTRDNNDIYIDAYVSYPIAVFGGQIEVPTLAGKVRLKIPSGIRPGQMLRLRNKGLPGLNSHRHGDLIVRINVHVPKHVSKNAKKIINDLGDELKENSEFKKFN